MLRVTDLEANLKFFSEQLGMVETKRYDHEGGRFTLVFLSAPGDENKARENKSPLIELTYNWPDESGKVEEYTGGRSFGHLAYRVENIYETCQRLLDAGVTIHRPPRDGHMAL